MSSLVRRIQKRIARGMGFYRSTDTIGENKQVKVIRNSDGDVVGFRWPQVQAPTKPKEE